MVPLACPTSRPWGIPAACGATASATRYAPPTSPPQPPRCLQPPRKHTHTNVHTQPEVQDYSGGPQSGAPAASFAALSCRGRSAWRLWHSKPLWPARAVMQPPTQLTSCPQRQRARVNPLAAGASAPRQPPASHRALSSSPHTHFAPRATEDKSSSKPSYVREREG